MNTAVFTVVAGANGSGKSTLTRWAKGLFQQSPVLDPDAIAVDLQSRPESSLSDLEAGKEVLRSAERFMAQSVSFPSKQLCPAAPTFTCCKTPVS